MQQLPLDDTSSACHSEEALFEHHTCSATECLDTTKNTGLDAQYCRGPHAPLVQLSANILDGLHTVLTSDLILSSKIAVVLCDQLHHTVGILHRLIRTLTKKWWHRMCTIANEYYPAMLWR